MEQLQQAMGYQFANQSLLKRALTHSSYANENGGGSYERLEFLGDSILSFVISSYLYQDLESFSEGGLSKLRAAIVCEPTLGEAAQNLGIGDHLILSKGEYLCGGRQRVSILADVFEAIVAAIYLDGGMPPAQRFVLEQLHNMITRAMQGKGVFRDYKTELQERMQHDSSNVQYRHVAENGPEHNKQFTVELSYQGKILAEGTGRSKKEAEQNAAMQAMEKLENGKV